MVDDEARDAIVLCSLSKEASDEVMANRRIV